MDKLDFELWKAKQANLETSSNYKTVVVIVLVLSVIIFGIIGAVNARNLVLPWAAGMITMVVIAAVLDIKANRKNKKLEAEWKAKD